MSVGLGFAQLRALSPRCHCCPRSLGPWPSCSRGVFKAEQAEARHQGPNHGTGGLSALLSPQPLLASAMVLVGTLRWHPGDSRRAALPLRCCPHCGVMSVGCSQFLCTGLGCARWLKDLVAPRGRYIPPR